MTSATKLVTSTLGAILALGAMGALAQDLPQLRDSRTGKVWTPEIANEEASVPTSPNAYVNRAFDPRAQNAIVEGVVVQHPRANLMGIVPITAGPTMPIATLDAPSLQVIPGRHWLSIVYVTNNSGATINAVVGCHFTNAGQRVEETRVVMPPAGPGERLGVPVRGPRYDIFVDRVTCELMSPA
jgi:hypothetical protein